MAVIAVIGKNILDDFYEAQILDIRTEFFLQLAAYSLFARFPEFDPAADDAPEIFVLDRIEPAGDEYVAAVPEDYANCLGVDLIGFHISLNKALSISLADQKFISLPNLIGHFLFYLKSLSRVFLDALQVSDHGVYPVLPFAI